MAFILPSHPVEVERHGIWGHGILHGGGTAQARTHLLQAGRQSGVFLLHLQLGAGSFRIRDGVGDLRLGAGQFGGTLEVLERLGNLALLQEKLGQGADGNVAFGVDWERC